MTHAIMQSSSTITPGVGITPTFANFKGRSLREHLLQGAVGSTSRHLLDTSVNTQVSRHLGESCADCMEPKTSHVFVRFVHAASL